ncbi:hypothetical protein [Streptomyces sp. NPDC056982]|uniref:hypothetical protein n=1 Tax=Streptomyces sp. NPDC056982 TaxID=3345986 RepID=UPI00362500FD
MSNRIGPLHVQAKHCTTQSAPTSSQVDAGQANEALRRSVAADIGPRAEGVVYDNASGTFKVLAVVTDASEARRILRRRAAQFAIEIVDIFTGHRDHTCSVWTGSDRVLKTVAL